MTSSTFQSELQIESNPRSLVIINPDTPPDSPQPPDPPQEDSPPIPEVKTEEKLQDEKIIENTKTSDKVSSPENKMFCFQDALYLGSSNVDAPMSRPEANRTMSILKQQSQASNSIHIQILLSKVSSGVLQLQDTESNTVLSEYNIRMILFCCRGTDENILDCFSFTVKQQTNEGEFFYCHVIQDLMPYSAFKMSDQNGPSSLVKAFSSAFTDGKSPIRSLNRLPLPGTHLTYHFDLSLHVREDIHGSWTRAPFEKGAFKLQIGANRKFKIKLTKRDFTHIDESTIYDIRIEKCFGMLVSLTEPDQDTTQESATDLSEFSSDSSPQSTHTQDPTLLSPLCLLEITSGVYNSEGVFVIEADWPIDIPQFGCFLEETPKNLTISLTIVADLILELVSEPVRFEKVFLVRFVRSEMTSTFNNFISNMSIKGRVCRESYILILTPSEKERKELELVKCEVTGREIPRISEPVKNEMHVSEEALREKIMSQEPLMSGSGLVSTEISEEVSIDWMGVLERWNWRETERPKHLIKLARKGIPEKYRGSVWQMLTKVLEDLELVEEYRILTTKHEGKTEPVIEWDIKRTFTAHEFFRDKTNHKLLLNLSTAYSLYDKEIGYCQGLSFIMAVLLLHVPEEQAFAMLVKIMCEYELREVFKPGLQTLRMKFYQLDCSLEEYMPDIYAHFKAINLETHMYASQWFLTVFAAKFPLTLAYRIFDIFLVEGLDQTIFSFALALLRDSKKEILSLDFEGVLQFFRATLPRKYLEDSSCQRLVDLATSSMRISMKKLKKYEKEFLLQVQETESEEDPLTHLERESRNLREEISWLQQENDKLAKELVDSKVRLREDMDVLEDKLDKKSKDVRIYQTKVSELQTELSTTVVSLKERESKLAGWIHRYEADKQQSEHTLAEYKDIVARMDEGHQAQVMDLKKQILELKAQLVKSQQPDVATCSDGSLEKNILNDSDRLQEVEMELAKTKLELCERNCQLNDLKHQLTAYTEQAQTSIFRKQKKIPGYK